MCTVRQTSRSLGSARIPTPTICDALDAKPYRSVPPELVGYVFERQFEDRLAAIIDDNLSATLRKTLHRFARGDLATPSSCFVDISELNALMVEHGHLTAPYVKVIAHWEDPRRLQLR